jgi:hypothetical protein
MAAAIRCPRNRMPQPKWVISMGACDPSAGFSIAIRRCGRQLGDSGGVLCSGKSPVARKALACDRVSARENTARAAERFENCECWANGDWSVKLSERRITEVTIRSL